MATEIQSWDDFERRLGVVLRELPERTCLIVGAVPTCFPFVQFSTNLPDAGLRVELCVFDYVSRSDYAPDVVDRLHRLGFIWTHETINWVRDVPFPSRDVVYDEVLEACVLVLRDGHGVVSPDSLGYECWRDPERVSRGVDYDPDELDPGEDGILIPGLGLDYVVFHPV